MRKDFTPSTDHEYLRELRQLEREEEADEMEREDENPRYGPGNPDWERDFDRD